jgi:transcription elongation factor GreA
MGTSYLSKEGYEELQQKLSALKVRRREIAEQIETARMHGDLKENAEYKTAKESQNLNEIHINELSNRLASARILDTSAINTDKACIGTKVTFLDMEFKEQECYALVAEEEADFAKNKVSVSSPVGKGLLGKAVGEVTEIKVPAGTLRYKIVKIEKI